MKMRAMERLYEHRKESPGFSRGEVQTLDYGTNDLQFEEYDKRMIKAKCIIESNLSE